MSQWQMIDGPFNGQWLELDTDGRQEVVLDDPYGDGYQRYTPHAGAFMWWGWIHSEDL